MNKLRTLVISLGIGAALAAAGCAVPEEGQSTQAVTSQDGRYIITYVAGHGAAARAAAKGLGGELARDLPSHNAFSAWMPAQAVAALSKNPAIDFVEVDARRKPMSTQQMPWGISRVLQSTTPSFSSATAGKIKVCIIDSGIDAGHEDVWNGELSGTDTTRTRRKGGGGGTIPWNEDTCGHGTHVAGTIAAADNDLGVVGIAPFAPGAIALHIVRVFEGSDCSWTYSSDLVHALDLCVGAGANVINMSLGGASPTSTEQAAFDNAYANGILPIAAAGNEQETTPGAYSYPASYASVVSVAAIDSAEQVASFSNENDQVELAAPGVEVLSTVPMGMGLAASLSTGDKAAPMEGSPAGNPTGTLVDCGTGEATCPAAAGNICLIERGNIAFSDKVLQCQSDGGIAAIIYDNVTGEELYGTLGGVATAIPSVGVSNATGQNLIALLGSSVTVTVEHTNYEYYQGTSMATPHVVGVAALVWSHDPSCTAAEVRAALTSTAKDLGDPGRDSLFGFGLIQAQDAVAALNCTGAPPPPPSDCTTTGCDTGYTCNTSTGLCEPDSTGGPGSCTDATGRATGCTCDADSQCYFGKCKGKPGSRTCN